MLLLILLSCLSFAISHGLSFDYFPGNVTVGIPVTLSWHRETNDPNQIDFVLSSLPGEVSLQGLHLLTATDTAQQDGTLNVTFPGSGEYTVEAITNQTGVVEVAAAQKFEVAPPSQNDSSDNGTAPSSNHETSIIIGAVIGSLVSLLLLGGGAFLFIARQRKRRNLKHRLSPNPKIQPELDFHSPPVGNKDSETVSPMLEGEMTPDLPNITTDTVEQSLDGNPAEDERERRNSIETHLHADTSEPQSTQQQEGPHAVLDDVAAEVLRLRVQVQQLIEREAERIQGNVFEPPPAYV
ncbi:hypothetical protein ARMSODRAFT_1009254 [Armillaria solidipes]|uniref:Uncharacterized protein n=1 Tax=Armillaria solidipes TaxID=1076256 RepID=A0A2H3ANZ7_9AGAR|nr:hypothetical protein ARMSODRAFT_1009254 [Armillaria solidipes]